MYNAQGNAVFTSMHLTKTYGYQCQVSWNYNNKLGLEPIFNIYLIIITIDRYNG